MNNLALNAWLDNVSIIAIISATAPHTTPLALARALYDWSRLNSKNGEKTA